MEDAIRKADVLVEAMSWIRRFRGQTVVIKLGGSIMKDPGALRDVLYDIVFMETVGMHPVVVHGGGAAISRAMEDAGIEAHFIQGRRYTDLASLSIVERVLVDEINRDLVSQIREFGGHAEAVSFRSHGVLRGQRLKLTSNDGDPIDLGFVGEITAVDHEFLRKLCDQGIVPMIPSMCQGENDEKLNVNADTAATAVAVSLQADKLVFLSDVNGVRLNKDDPNSLVNSLDASKARSLIADGTIATGMIPKVESCLDTLAAGVGKVHIIDGRLKHSLLLEIYTDSGIGTEIVP